MLQNYPSLLKRMALLVGVSIASMSGPLMASETVSAATNQYMGAPVTLVEAPNGAMANKKLLDGIDKVGWIEPTIEQPVPGVYVLGGYALATITVIETDKGFIAFVTGDSKHDGELLLEAIRTFSDKPIKAIIYGHSHTVFGASILTEGNTDIQTIGHPNLNDVVANNLLGGGAPAYFPELGPYLTGRAATQFNMYMPDEGPDAWVLPLHLVPLVSAYIPVNTPVEHGQEMTVLGERMQFFTKWGSDDKVHTMVWIPDREIVLTTLLWSGPPQLYSIRGDVFRDPREWIEGLKFMRDLKPKVIMSAASKQVVGQEEIQTLLNGYIDGANFVLDQTLRGIINGQGPDELRHTVVFPDYLNEVPNNLQNYGEISSYSPAIYTHAVGWYDNDAANLKPLAPIDEANRLVKLMGGYDSVVKAAKEAMTAKEYSWSAQLANYLYIQNPVDQTVRQLKADALRQMAYVSTGGNDRAHLMSQALSLEGKLNIARNVYPAEEYIVASPSAYVDFYRTRLDFKASDSIDQMVRFNFDNGEEVGLHVRRAVAEYIESPDEYLRKADITLTISTKAWGQLYLSKASFAGLVESGDIKVNGDLKTAIKVFSVFDKIEAQTNLVIPPMPDQ